MDLNKRRAYVRTHERGNCISGLTVILDAPSPLYAVCNSVMEIRAFSRQEFSNKRFRSTRAAVANPVTRWKLRLLSSAAITFYALFVRFFCSVPVVSSRSIGCSSSRKSASRARDMCEKKSKEISELINVRFYLAGNRYISCSQAPGQRRINDFPSSSHHRFAIASRVVE